jgi:hypothetical protein
MEKRSAIREEIHKLLAAGFIKVFHPEWLANPILVKKKNGKWRMCVDYTGLSKACPKHPFPLPRIDQIVDSTSGCVALSFLDAYSGYHQIMMKESIQLAASFVNPFRTYYYLLSRDHAIWPQERGGYVSALYAHRFWGSHWVDH